MQTAALERTRLKLCVRGAVQGVGFRPFVFRLANELNLSGWVNNSPQGVFIEVEGDRISLEQFLLRLETEKPPRSFIQSLESCWLDACGYNEFEIRESDAGGDKTALVLPDIATCPDCVREIFDPANRRYFYPFTNCTNCGPRFSIIGALPYDRANTSMKAFTMCPQCQAEYNDPRNRRFHAQPNACPGCGPRLELWDSEKRISPVSDSTDARSLLEHAADAIRSGQIVAVKGLGGIHLMVAAHDERAVQRLRERKHREEKPFAVMFPSPDAIKAVCEVSPPEERLLRSPEAPIVLLKRWRQSRSSRARVQIPDEVAPGNPNLGIMLPYTPLHHLLMSLLGFPVVATSGNLSDEPICIDEHEALVRLGGIADVFLVHNRPIVRHVDDSIVRVMMDREMVLRRARGYAPLPIVIKSEARKSNSILAVGAHLKNTVALSVGPQVFLSQHIGDLETDQAFGAFRRVIADFEKLYEAKPAVVAADFHPNYLSTRFANGVAGGETRQAVLNRTTQDPSPALKGTLSPTEGERDGVRGARDRQSPEDASKRAVRLVAVQHHVAHILSCMAENELEPPVLGVAWDGTGYGLDGAIWGGEFFHVTGTSCERVAHLRQFRLPGGDRAVKESRRSALGVLYEMLGDAAFNVDLQHFLRGMWNNELPAVQRMLKQKINSPLTSSAGRLFDAVAALVGLRATTRFEGQAAMELEFAIDDVETDECYNNLLSRDTQSPMIVDWAPMIEAIRNDVRHAVLVAEISARFHNTLAEMIVAVARRVGETRVVLSGGCFQNRYLTERTVRRLEAEGFRPYWHQRVPPNDGGIALGQIVAALREKG